MATTLRDWEHEVLFKLVNGQFVALSSNQRVRQELAGAIRDGAQGIVVTAEGRRLARRRPASDAHGSTMERHRFLDLPTGEAES
jgi:hypothetical protein